MAELCLKRSNDKSEIYFLGLDFDVGLGPISNGPFCETICKSVCGNGIEMPAASKALLTSVSVSYTHLTLPTICSV